MENKKCVEEYERPPLSCCCKIRFLEKRKFMFGCTLVDSGRGGGKFIGTMLVLALKHTWILNT